MQVDTPSTGATVAPRAAAAPAARMPLVAALAHAAQAAVMVALANDASLPVTANFATGPPGSPLDG